MSTTARITFSVPSTTAELAAKRASHDRRSLSAYVTLLIERDLADAGLTGGDLSDSQLTQLIKAASKEDPKFPAKLMKLIPASLRGTS